MRILVVGKGGREHALVTALHESPGGHKLFCYPGSDAIRALAETPPVDGLESLVSWMSENQIDLCVAGEESFLVTGAGLANLCAKAGIPCWGPPREAAMLEASKEFAKDFMIRHGIPTAGHRVVSGKDEAMAALTCYPVVLKFDGLAAGKGVAVCQKAAEAEAFLDEVFVDKRFGPGRLIIEDCLTGPEISIFASVSGADYQVLMAARDYKRIGDGDEGPNTGGMGAVASLDIIPADLLGMIEETMVKATVEGLVKDRLPYRGFLYFGIMLTPQGPKLLEYNCRFGDPEAEAVLPMVTGDFAGYLEKAARGHLQSSLIGFRSGWSICVILASAGYPDSSRNGDRIEGLDQLDEARVFHCGTRRDADGYFVTNGGRVLAVVAQAGQREEAVEKVEREHRKISFAGAQRRSDIGRLHFGEVIP